MKNPLNFFSATLVLLLIFGYNLNAQIDTIPPFAKSKNLTVYLDNSGNATITASMIDNGSYDNIGIASLSLTRTNFSCADLNNSTPNFALDFDGIDDRVVSFSSFGLPQGSSDRTVEMWIKTTQTSVASLFSFGNFSYLQRAGLYLVSGRLYFVGEFNDVWGGNTLVNNGQWHHIAFTLAGKSIRFYIDGQFDFATTLSTFPQTTGTAWAMSNTSGISYTREPFYGQMDEVRVWSSVRTDSEIQSFYNKPLGGNEANLVSYYPLDNGNGNIAFDITHNRNNGLLTNMDASSDWVAGAPPFGHANRVKLIVTDFSSNRDTAGALVTVIDNMAPTVLTKNVTVQLDGSGQASITTNDVNNGSWDNCGLSSLSVSPTTFDCSDISFGTDGVLKYNLTADNAFEMYISTDNNSPGTPVLSGSNFGVKYSNQTNLTQGQDYWIHVKAIDLGLIEMFIGDFKLSGSFMFDNGQQTLGTNTTNWKVSRTGFGQNERTPFYAGYQGTNPWYSWGYQFGAYHVWDSVWNTSGNDTVYFSAKISATSTSNLVTLTATDGSGNTSSGFARVIVKDNLAPEVITKNATIQLDANGQATITTGDVDNGSSDNCGIQSLSVSPNTFDCADVSTGSDGVLKSNLTADNAFEYYISTNNNSNGTLLLTGNNWGAKYSNQTNLAEGQDYWLHVKGIDHGLIEMFIGDFTLTGSFKFANGTQTLGTNTTNWKVSRTGFGQNERTPFYAGYQGTNPWYSWGYQYNAYHIWDSVWNTNGTDTVYFSTKISATSNSNLVTLTATDASGNTSAGTARVIVKDYLAPTVVTQNVTIQLDANGQGTITTGDVDNGSSDNCGIESMSLNLTSFDCSDIGENEVILSVKDVHGNTGSGTAEIEVVDNIAPTVVTQDIAVQLDANGQASIVAGDVNNGSYDNCSISEMNVFPNEFDCSLQGQTVSVVLTVKDGSGNTSTGLAQVTVLDNIAPTAVCKSVNIYLNENGLATISDDDVDDNSNDNCGITARELSQYEFTCSNVGATEVRLTVSDAAGNSASCVATVNVFDNIAPTAVCQSVTVELDENGQGTISVDDVNNGSYDNCGIGTIELNNTEFDCSNVGTNYVDMTVTDVHGNVSTCTAEVEVFDFIAPTAVCQNATVYLDENGSASIEVSDIDNGSSDICGISSMTLDVYDFDCSNLGDNTVVLTVTDVNGNTSTCQANVSVVDNIPPTISVSVNPSVLWPPNHKMQTITATVTVDDNCSLNSESVSLKSVTSNEPDNGLGDGDKPNDIQGTSIGTNDLSFDLRKERSGGGTGRIYTVVYTVVDAGGNETDGVAYVTVPHDQARIVLNDEIKTSDEETIEISSLSVYPNPTANKINIAANFGEKGNIEISITNEIGQILKTRSLGTSDNINQIFDVSDFASGFYFIHIKHNNEMIIKAFIKE